MRGLSVGVWVKAGTRHERPREEGSCHFLEHMLFKGTTRLSALELAKIMDQAGGDFNAFTAREYTCFHLLLLNKDFRLGLGILGDILLNSQLPPEEMERERNVILQEIAMIEESPEEMVHDCFFELAFGKHRLGAPILGSVRSVRGVQRKALLRFFHQHYRPSQLVIAVAGDVAHSELKAALSSLASPHWPGRKPQVAGKAVKPRRSATPALASAAGPLRQRLGIDPREPLPVVSSGFWWVERPTEQVHLVWGVEGQRVDSKDRFAALLLNIYLGGGMSSSLFQEIREKNGLAYTVYSSLSPFADSGLFSIYAATGASQVSLCLKLIEECVDRVKRVPLEEAELEMIRNNLKNTILISSDDVETRMSSIAKNEIYFGKYISVEEVCDAIDRVTPADIRRVARQLFAQPGRTIVALGPKPSKTLQKQYNLEFPGRFARK